MKLNRDRMTRGSGLVIAGFALLMLAENGCSDSSAPSTTIDAGNASDDAGLVGCFAGETPRNVGSSSLCCSGTVPNLVCNGGGRVGDPCSASSFPATQQTVNVTLDTCVSDDCNGDHNPVTYDAKIVAVTTPLACTNGSLAAAGSPTTQEVDRVCADAEPLTCAGGDAAAALEARAPSVTSSTCSTSNSAPAPCPVGAY